MLHWINNLVILKMNTISSLSGVWRCSGWQRAGCRTETGDLGDWCQCGNLQGEVSGVNAVCLTTVIHSWLAKSWSSWQNDHWLKICVLFFAAFPSAIHRPQLQRGWERWSGPEWAALYAETGWGEKCSTD